MTVFANDADLLRRFRLGDRDALSTVYWFYVARVEFVVRRGLLLAGAGTAERLRADMADLAQEAFVHAFAPAARQAYDATRPYGPYLLVIARNALVDHLRRAGREQNLELSQIEELLAPRAEWQVEDVPWADAQTMALVERYVADLPARERAVYVQRFGEGRSQLQAADVLGLSRQQVRTLESHVRDGLARALARAKLSGSTYAGSLVPLTPDGFPRLKSEDD